ncbi:MAG: DUF2780 domain-containing protein [Pseudomonadota bacterium]
MIDQLIQQIAAKLGIPPETAQQAVGTLMSLLQEQGDNAKVNELLAQIPGASALAAQYSGSAAAEQASGLGGMMGKLGGLMGGKAGNAMEAMAAFKGTGLSMSQAQEMLPVAKDFFHQHADSELVQKALSSVPALKGLMSS